jgi:hypothetical protein
LQGKRKASEKGTRENDFDSAERGVELDHGRNLAMMLQIVQHNVDNQSADVYAESCAVSIRSINVISAIKTEMVKMDEEIRRCYEIADQNSIYGLKREAATWNARAQAFRDCLEILKKHIGGD